VGKKECLILIGKFSA